jgi:hypothetical protein
MMCQIYKNEKIILKCSQDNCRCGCGNACNHCPYAGDYNYSSSEEEV